MPDCSEPEADMLALSHECVLISRLEINPKGGFTSFREEQEDADTEVGLRFSVPKALSEKLNEKGFTKVAPVRPSPIGSPT